MTSVIPIEDLRRNPRSVLFEGGDEAPISIFMVNFERGQGPNLHAHPYPEVFVVQAGTAAFTAGDEELVVTEGNMVIVPAQTPHRFTGAGDDTLRVLSVQPSPTVQQTDL